MSDYLNLTSIKKSVLDKHRPSPSYSKKLIEFTNDLIYELWCNNDPDHNASHFPISDIVLGGSVAKGTWLKDSADIDIFIKLESDSTRKDLENSLEIGKKTLDSLNYSWKLRYSEHPYIESEVNLHGKAIKINIVSCFDVNPKDWNRGTHSAADRSPHHTNYILNNFTSSIFLIPSIIILLFSNLFISSLHISATTFFPFSFLNSIINFDNISELFFNPLFFASFLI